MTRRTGFPASVIELVTARSSGECECMATGCTLIATQYHHRRARGAGGTRRPETNHASNALHVCAACHSRIESDRQWALANGFLVPQRLNPRLLPVWWRCTVSCLLDDGGQWIPVRHAGNQETPPESSRGGVS